MRRGTLRVSRETRWRDRVPCGALLAAVLLAAGCSGGGLEGVAVGAQAHAAGDPELADAVWQAGELAVREGGGEPLDAAKALARQQAPGAAQALLEWARVRRHRG